MLDGLCSWFDRRESHPILSSFDDDQGCIGDCARGVEAMQFWQRKRSGGLILSIDVVIARRGAHREQLWRFSVGLTSLEERRAVR